MTWGVAWLWLLVGCGESTPLGDAGDAGEVDAPAVLAIEAPAEPAPPELPCPEGFRALHGACDPFSGRLGMCANSGEIDVPGSDGCEPVSSPCPEDFPDEEGDLFVRRGAIDGDGSRDAPFGRILDAVRAASPGDTILVAAGRYMEELTLARPVTLVGACASETIIASEDESLALATVTVTGEDVTLRDFTFVGLRSAVLVTTGSARVERVIVPLAVDGALVARGGDLSVDHVLVRLPPGIGPCAGALGGDLTVTRSVFEGCSGTGIAAANRGTARLDSIVVRGSRSNATGDGVALLLDTRGHLELQRSVIEDSEAASVLVRGEGAEVSITDCVIRGGHPDDEGVAQGIAIYEGGVDVERTLIEDTLDTGIFSYRGRLSVRDVIIRGTRPRTNGRFGRGLEIEEGSTASIERVLLEENSDSGLYVAGEGALLTGTDLTAIDTKPNRRDVYFGYGVVVSDGAHVELQRVRLSRNSESGLVVRRATATIEDLHVDGTLPDRIGYYGRGIEVEACSPGPGVQRLDCGEAHLSLLRAWVEGVHDVAVRTADPGAFLEASHLRIEGTQLSACSDGICMDSATGVGVGAYHDSQIAIDTFSVTDNAVCGMQLYKGGMMDLRFGEVARNPVGVNVQTEGFDTSRLVEDVRFEDNAANLDTARLPVPEAVLR